MMKRWLKVQHTLKVTNVLSDPTRFSIYQYMIRQHQTVSVLDISRQFDIHPNVARLHLSNLEDIYVIKQEREGAQVRSMNDPIRSLKRL